MFACRLRPSQVFDEAAKSRRKVVLSVISLAEVVYLVEKNRLPASVYADLQQALHDPDHVLQEAPVTSEVIDAMLEVSRADIPDMPDRIVAATAVYFGVPLLVATAASTLPACKLSGDLIT